MKKTIALTSVLLLIAVSVFLTTGCASTPSSGAGGTNVVTKPVIDAHTINDAAIVLRNAARNAAALSIQDNPDARKYVILSVTALDTFLVGGDYTPGALSAALQPVVKQISDVRIALAVDTVVDLYEAFFGRYVKGQIAAAGNGTALLFLTNLREGANSALEITANATVSVAHPATTTTPPNH